jgi:hypothetical protein
LINIYSAPQELTSPKIALALQEATAGTIWTDNIPRSGTWAGFGSPSNLNTLTAAQERGDDFFFVDHAYFGRGYFYRITKNALFHSGRGKSDLSRLKFFHRELKPWVYGANIIICPQSEGFFRRQGIAQADWIFNVINQLKKVTSRRIIIHHKRDPRPLSDLLANAHAVIVHSSNSAVEALMAGVPVFATAPCPAAALAEKDLSRIEKPFYPKNRMEFAGVLADNQWSLEEIRNGTAWRFLND